MRLAAAALAALVAGPAAAQDGLAPRHRAWLEEEASFLTGN